MVMPHIQLSSQWRYFKGAAHGLRSAHLSGELRVRRLSADCDLAALGETVASITGMQLDRYEPTGNTADELLDSLLTWHVLLQQHAKIPLFDSHKLRHKHKQPEDGARHYQAILPCLSPNATQVALRWLVKLANQHLTDGVPGAKQVERERRSFNEILNELIPFRIGGVNSFHFLQAAHDLNLPAQQIDGRIFAFGNGCNCRWLKSSISDQTSCLGVELAHDKFTTAKMLERHGLPAPTHIKVSSREQALKAAGKLGFPVVIKPADQEQGRGVEANLRTKGSLLSAYDRAIKISKRLLVEKHFSGKDYRVTVFLDRVIRVENRVAGGVTGDGVATVRQLIAELQRSPRFQKALRDSGKMMIALDDEASELLAEMDMKPDDVPAPGQYVCLRRKSNISTGGAQLLVSLDDVHPDNLRLAVRAAKALRLDIAGIDLIIPDIARSWMDVGAIICEVNAQPQIGKKNTPEIYREMLSELVGGQGRIPIHLVISPRPLACPAPAKAAHLMRERKCNALSMATGVWVDGEIVARNFADSFHAAEAVLANQDAKSALCILAMEDVINHGLPANRFESITLILPPRRSAEQEYPLESLLPMIEPHTYKLIRHELSA